jgi:hypothetical protein
LRNKCFASEALKSALIAIFAEHSTCPDGTTIIPQLDARDAAAFAGDRDATLGIAEIFGRGCARSIAANGRGQNNFAPVIAQ